VKTQSALLGCSIRQFYLLIATTTKENFPISLAGGGRHRDEKKARK